MFKTNAVLMGKNTYLSIGSQLKKRINIVITSNPYVEERQYNKNLYIFNTPLRAYNYVKHHLAH